MKKTLQIKRKQECWSLVPGLTYARVPAWYDASVKNLRMSILMPKHREDRKHLPLLIWLCGGAFQVMDPNVWIPQWTEFARRGCVVAGVEYRTANEAPFPAALEDVKAAIRFLRANASLFGIDPRRIFAAGESAGGCLACLAGVYGKERRYDVGEYTQYSSRIQGVIDFYGVTDFTDISHQEDAALDMAGKLFLGGRDREEEASPYLHVDSDTPPFLIFHGDRDELVDVRQSEKMYQSLTDQGISADLCILEGCGHGADEFYQREVLEMIEDFIHKNGGNDL